MDGHETDSDTERFMSLTAKALRGRMEIGGEVVGRTIRDGVRSHGKPSRDYASVLLETDGLGWSEREGPTLLFSNIGAQGGLAWFFPTLPASAGHDASVTWSVPFNSGQSIKSIRVEATRGNAATWSWLLGRMEGGDDRDIPTTFTRADLRYEDSSVENGVRVSIYSMTASRRVEPDERDAPFPMIWEKTYRGSYAITGAGRVLRAHVESNQTTTTLDQDRRPHQTIAAVTDAKMHLVAACDGPVAPSLAPVLTEEEKAAPPDDQLRIEVVRPKAPKPP